MEHPKEVYYLVLAMFILIGLSSLKTLQIFIVTGNFVNIGSLLAWGLAAILYVLFAMTGIFFVVKEMAKDFSDEGL